MGGPLRKCCGGPARTAEPGQPPLPASPRVIALGNFGAARRHRHRRAGGARPPFSLLPPFRGEVGRGVPPLRAPASRRHRAKRERGCGPSARQAGGTPALPGSSRMGGIGKVPVGAAEPGQPPSRPPPFQGGGEKTQGEERKRRGPPPRSAIGRRSLKCDCPAVSPFQVGGEKRRYPTPRRSDSSPLPGGRGETAVSDALMLRLLPPSRWEGRDGGGAPSLRLLPLPGGEERRGGMGYSRADGTSKHGPGFAMRYEGDPKHKDPRRRGRRGPPCPPSPA